MWANTVWGCLGFSGASFLGWLAMIAANQNQPWRKLLGWAAVVFLIMGIVAFFWPHESEGTNISGKCNGNTVNGTGNTQNNNCQTYNSPPHTVNRFYSKDGHDIGFAEWAVADLATKKISMRIFHVQDGFPWGKEIEFNDFNVVCADQNDGHHSYGKSTDPSGTWYKFMNSECDIQ